ncbi:selection and upkeep of intraepithelial T-cells protein 7-like [Oreochromis aureus]|uniref:selection and upkeep of intraepithelial T-cells protein 7-like n=1 Tax=Oreochromis aureus TaxID=47969 RepID=UPI001954C711|nr:selection and upkeep of intraepithelial T-cells protein 7-like [Oreochromis aureus]
MSAGICIFFCSILLLAGVFVSVSADQKNITVQSGQTVSLPCQAPNNKGTIRVVRWTKPGLQNENVYLYVDRRFYLEEQNPSFKNRVDLQDRQMKDGNVSLILKDVTVNDAGTYKCLIRVLLAASTNDHINNITLRVVPPGQTRGFRENGSVGLKVGLYVPVLLLFLILFFEVQNM